MISFCAAADGQPQEDIVLNWSDGYGLFTHSSPALGNEVQSAFGTMGVRVDWRDDGLPAQPLETPLLRIYLRPSEPGELRLPHDALGVALGGIRTEGPIFVFFPNVVRTVASSRRAAIHKGKRAEELEKLRHFAWRNRNRVSRALGKVIAHEVVHAVTPEPDHAAEGLMRPHLIPALLFESRLPVDQASVVQFRRALTRWTPIPAQRDSARQGNARSNR